MQRLNLFPRKTGDFSPVFSLAPHVLSHSLVLGHALGEDFLLDQHILKPGMVFDEVGIKGDVPIEDFGGGPDLAVFLGVPVLLAPSDIGGLLADGVLRHLQGVPHGHAVGQKVAALGLGDIAQGVIGGAIIEARVVGDDGLDIVLLAQVSDMALGGIDRDDLALALSDLGLIHGPLLGIIGGIEQGAVSAEHVIDDEAESLIDAALLVVDTAAQVVHHRIVQAVRGLGVDGQIVIAALVDSHFRYLIFHSVNQIGVPLSIAYT